MNSLEKRMIGVLENLKENYHVIGVKAEFEAEGTRLEEALRLKEVVSKAGLDLTIKIGGCEALKDMYEARVIGVSRIVAPMIESSYALRKFLTASKLAFSPDEREEIDFLINIETITAFKNLDDILNSASINELDGIILGRGDMSESLGLTRDDINKPEILEITKSVLMKAKEKFLICGIGGGVSGDSLPFFRNLPIGFLDFYETRKVIFKCPAATDKNASEGILKAVGFELMWLKNKANYYGLIYNEDKERIKILESRYESSILAAGGLIE
ncbi:MAG: citrate lyase beta subunit [Candidatus Melainabacteria bacterium RIFOXYA12_FULL_32_12]|nr:MAG: citrate lyase beta subunit [Candidatus Melainabacteria bacterium GWF2_32_7]OGI22852.1 MAG: citrate lyase beta subunit [Candidatus Melainabacteria bacterium RIFOXYA2_FULL_32_9]OGI30848.1 MAG: citrate lyase beta subunit [Candidatus Melainabacteria bacterium RIFOXYA12_FULL_32_12]